MSATEIMWLREYVRSKGSPGDVKETESIRERKMEIAIEAISANAHLHDSIEGIRKPGKD